MTAFTLAEAMIIFVIIGIITLITISIGKTQINQATKMATYATYKNLQNIAGELVAKGYTYSSAQAYNDAKKKTDDAYNYWNSLPDTVSHTETQTQFVSYLQSDYDMYYYYDQIWAHGSCNGDLVYCNTVMTDNAIWLGKTIREAIWLTDYFGSMPIIQKFPTYQEFLDYMDSCHNMAQYYRDRYYNGYYVPINVTVTVDNPAKAAAWADYLNLKAISDALLITLGAEEHIAKKELPLLGYAVDTNGVGTGFCNITSDLINSIGTVDCQRTTTNVFNDSTVNFKASNGSRFYNFGAKPIDDPDHIADPQNGDPTKQKYTIYVDVDGSRGKSILNKDVFQFTIDRTGKVLPEKSSPLATDSNVLSASVKYQTVDATGKVTTKILESGVSIKEAACKSGYTTDATYCGGITTDTNCLSTNSTCQFVINKP